jgi:hypothetical protein
LDPVRLIEHSDPSRHASGWLSQGVHANCEGWVSRTVDAVGGQTASGAPADGRRSDKAGRAADPAACAATED